MNNRIKKYATIIGVILCVMVVRAYQRGDIQIGFNAATEKRVEEEVRNNTNETDADTIKKAIEFDTRACHIIQSYQNDEIDAHLKYGYKYGYIEGKIVDGLQVNTGSDTFYIDIKCELSNTYGSPYYLYNSYKDALIRCYLINSQDIERLKNYDYDGQILTFRGVLEVSEKYGGGHTFSLTNASIKPHE